jgi:glycerophosphoryl diester phosphodiesterase
MIIIGHRGAAGIEPENTIPSIKAAVSAGVDMIEFDLRVTKDRQLVLLHDTSLARIAGENKNISEMTLEEVNLTTTLSGHPIPSLQEALKATKGLPVLLDCKGQGWAELVCNGLKTYKGPTPTVTAADTSEMLKLKQLRPDIETYVSELVKPFEGVYKARLLGFTGVSLNFWVLTPLAYYYAKKHGLKFMIFTVNNKFFARFLHLLYPGAAIITNVPNKLAPLAKRQTDKAKGSTSTRR